MIGYQKSTKIRAKKIESFFNNRQLLGFSGVIVATVFGNFSEKKEKIVDDVAVIFFVVERVYYFAFFVPDYETQCARESLFEPFDVSGHACQRWRPTA